MMPSSYPLSLTLTPSLLHPFLLSAIILRINWTSYPHIFYLTFLSILVTLTGYYTWSIQCSVSCGQLCDTPCNLHGWLCSDYWAPGNQPNSAFLHSLLSFCLFSFHYLWCGNYKVRSWLMWISVSPEVCCAFTKPHLLLVYHPFSLIRCSVAVGLHRSRPSQHCIMSFKRFNSDNHIIAPVSPLHCTPLSLTFMTSRAALCQEWTSHCYSCVVLMPLLLWNPC